PSPMVTSKETSPRVQECSPEKRTSEVLESTQSDLMEEFSLRKQCSYMISHKVPLSMYNHMTCLPDIQTLTMTGSKELSEPETGGM
ncbi:hypothetical protein Tco_1453992, partial [Tanacetum coccineum]